ncbi:hypothetical protein BCR33DRAFT_719493 [Rhizoclosmatium globosum]|uniref:Uncharacterized protein n=1 Tax=Rhizoclosmatium globosum TaxID=329046 RepID=A0A1Y2C0K3_9FUNG|nr:hypothetical protein BCR33DRAFT_719493 [Rhizoclosmatium globosum]|eukprot:ORY40541.1 hypothetical protein BCR33DRAFT_719493 [Rhizoclosmatium globosum]
MATSGGGLRATTTVNAGPADSASVLGPSLAGATSTTAAQAQPSRLIQQQPLPTTIQIVPVVPALQTTTTADTPLVVVSSSTLSNVSPSELSLPSPSTSLNVDSTQLHDAGIVSIATPAVFGTMIALSVVVVCGMVYWVVRWDSRRRRRGSKEFSELFSGVGGGIGGGGLGGQVGSLKGLRSGSTGTTPTPTVGSFEKDKVELNGGAFLVVVEEEEPKRTTELTQIVRDVFDDRVLDVRRAGSLVLDGPRRSSSEVSISPGRVAGVEYAAKFYQRYANTGGTGSPAGSESGMSFSGSEEGALGRSDSFIKRGHVRGSYGSVEFRNPLRAASPPLPPQSVVVGVNYSAEWDAFFEQNPGALTFSEEWMPFYSIYPGAREYAALYLKRRTTLEATSL